MGDIVLTDSSPLIVIAMARRKNLIPSAADVFERLLQMDFRLSAEVIRAALEAAGER